MNIRFRVRHLHRTGLPAGDVLYEAGQTYDVREDRARKWMRQGLAEDASAPASVTNKAGPTPPGRAEHRAARGVDLDDQGTGAPPPPNPMTTADMPKPQPTPPAAEEERAAVAPAPVAESQDELDSWTREDLLELVEKRGIETPSGYLSKAALIKLARRQAAGV